MCSASLTPSGEGAPAPERGGRRNRRAWLWHLLAALAVVFFAWLRIFSVRDRLAPAVNFLDHSWQIDLLSKARQQVWLGRDVVFTYGPLYQWLWDRLRLDNGTLGSLVITSSFFPYGLSVASIYGATALLLRGQTASRRILCFLLIVAFWSPWDPKLAVAVFALALFLTLLPAVPAGWTPLLARATLIAGLVATAFLLSADAGFYSGAAALIAFACAAFARRENRTRYLGLLLLTALFLFAAMVAINSALFHPFDFRFWRNSAALVGSYRWIAPWPMFRELRVWLLTRVATCIFVFGWAWSRGRGSAAAPARVRSLSTGGVRSRWLGLLFFGVLALETALVRSDLGHVVDGVFPLAGFTLILLLSSELGPLGPTRRQAAGAVALALLFCGLGKPLWLLRPMAAVSACAAGQQIFDQACVTPEMAARLRSAASFLQAHSSARDTVAIFPWENLYGFAAGRGVSGGVLQNYLASGDYLPQLQIAGWEREPPPLALYSVDGLATSGLDLVPNFTRSPQAWLYLQRNYEQQALLAPGLLGLARTPERARRWSEEFIPLAGESRVRPQANAFIPLTPPPLPAPADFDFVRISLCVRYPVWWKLLKPAEVKLRIRTSAGQTREIDAVIPPNQPYELWIFPWESSALARLFSPNPAEWRGPRPGLQSLAMKFRRSDSFAVFPRQVVISKVEAVGLRLH